MNIQIKNRFTGSVIFEHDCENNTVKITVSLAVSLKINLSDANLSDANLYGANLSCANLSDATGNGREVLSFVALDYRGVYTADFIWIGCRKHPTKTWWKDSEKEAHTFTPKQIDWRKKNKSWITAMVKNNPAVPTKKAEV